MQVMFSQHALQQMFNRNITIEQVRFAITYGEEIRNYPDDKPYPSLLLLAFINEIPIHVVLAKNLVEKLNIVITVYHPDTKIWMKDFKTRR